MRSQQETEAGTREKRCLLACPLACAQLPKIYFIFVYVGVLRASISEYRVCVVPIEASSSGSLKPDFEMVLSCHVDAGNETQLWKNSECS